MKKLNISLQFRSLAIWICFLLTAACIESQDTVEDVGTDKQDDVIVTVNNIQVEEGDSGSKLVNVAVNMFPPQETSKSFSYSLVGVDAESGVDFEKLGSSFVIPAGQTLGQIPVLILGDTDVEKDETIRVLLVGDATLNTGQEVIQRSIILVDDDPLPSVSINDASSTEGGVLVFNVSLSEPAKRNIDLLFSTVADGKASIGNDFSQISGKPITFYPGQDLVQVDVSTTFDELSEIDETFTVSLTAVTERLTAVDHTATATIIDDDPQPYIQFSQSDVITREHQSGYWFDIEISEVSGRDIVAELAANSDSTAVWSQDYIGFTNVITITEGNTSAQFGFFPMDDAEPELKEYLNLRLQNLDGAQLGSVSVTSIEIEESDTLPENFEDLAQKRMGIRILGNVYGGSASYVTSGGDINGDGYDDILILAKDLSHDAHIIYGGPTFENDINLTSATGPKSYGYTWDLSGTSDQRNLSVVGDVDADGLDDIIFHEHLVSSSQLGTARTYSDLTAISEVQTTAYCNRAHDYNGDGYFDIICRARQHIAGVYMMFGRDKGSFLPLGDPGFTNSSHGFSVDEHYSGYETDFGSRPGAAGDLNDDGYDDVLVACRRCNDLSTSDGQGVYLFFGRSSGFADFNIDDYDNQDVVHWQKGTQSFRFFDGDIAVAQNRCGDINGDGYVDTAFGEASNLYIATGRSGAHDHANWQGPNSEIRDGVIQFSTDNRVTPRFFNGGMGSMHMADIDYDGFADFIFPKRFGDPGEQKGEIGLIFGDDGYLPATGVGGGDIDSFFNLFGAHAMYGENIGDNVGSIATGDINGDGATDIIVGMDGADGTSANSGIVYIIWGGNVLGKVDFNGTNSPESLAGLGVAERFVGLDGDDTIQTGGGADVVYAGRGDDTISIDDASFMKIDGNHGEDTLVLNGISLDLTTISRMRLQSIEAIDMSQSGASQTLTLDNSHIRYMTEVKTNHPGEIRLQVLGDSGDQVVISDVASSWTSAGAEMIGPINFQRFEHNHSLAVLLVQTGVAVTLP